MPFNVCFLNVGEETEKASLLARSVIKYNPGAKVIQLTDMTSPEVPYVSEVRRFAGDSEQIIRFRIMAYASVDITVPTWF